MVQPISSDFRRSSLSFTQPILNRSFSHLFSHASALSPPKERKYRKTISLMNLASLELPWDLLFCKNPLLNEMIADTKGSLQFRKRPHDEISLIVSQCLTIAQNESTAKEYLGYICFLCEYGYRDLLEAISECELPIVKAHLKLAFDKGLYELLKPIIDLENSHRKVNVQEAQRASIMMFPRLIAKAIISGPHVCNFGIIIRLKENFNGPLAFHKHLQYVLSELESNSQLRHQIRLMKKPRSQDAPANDIIRMTLNLDPAEEIVDWHAQITALSAVLTDLRQGRVGSCFATFLAINQLNTNLSKTLDDFREILLSSCLTRHLNGQARLFPLILEASYHFRDKAFSVSREGKLDNGSFIWDSPGLIAACKYAGIADCKEAVVRTLRGLSKDADDSGYLTLNSTLLMEAVLERENPYRDQSLLKKSMLAFESQTNHLLLRVWETTIAHMAESDDKGITTKLLVKSLVKILSVICNNALFLEEFTSLFSQRSRFLYNTHLKLRLIDDEDNGYYGSFILYDTQREHDAGYWRRMDSSQLFLQFLQEIMISCASLDALEKNRLIRLIHSPAFLADLVDLFGEKFDRKEFSWPWMNFSGNDPMRVYRNYHELTHLQPKSVAGITDAKDLLCHLIDMMRTNPLQIKTHLYSRARFCIPVFIEERHACRADLRSPFLLAALKDRRESDEWVAQVYLEPLRGISERILSDEQREEMLSFAESQGEFEPGMNLVEFRNALLIRMPELSQLHLDWFIFNQILTEAERLQLLMFAIPLIDTNWEESGYHVHVGFMFNPGSGKIEFWKIRSDMKRAAPTDQSVWISDYTFIV